VVKNHLTKHLLSNNLLDSFQSANTKYHSTESCRSWSHYQSYEPAKSYNFMPIRSSAAIGTIYHSILLHRLSRFGLSDKALSWLSSYLASRSFVMNSFVSDQFPLHQGSSLRFCSWLTSLHSWHHPLSSISNSTCGHYLHADDTQLFLSFAASDFSANMLRLHATIDLVSNWMSSNLLSPNQAKIEFFLIDLPAQISKLAHPTLLICLLM